MSEELVAQSDVLKTLRDAERATERVVKRGQRELNGIRAAIVAVAGSLAISVRGGGRVHATRHRSRTATTAPTKTARGAMSAAARKAVSIRMKKYWAMRRKTAKK